MTDLGMINDKALQCRVLAKCSGWKVSDVGFYLDMCHIFWNLRVITITIRVMVNVVNVLYPRLHSGSLPSFV
jgi:hypothetical protein